MLTASNPISLTVPADVTANLAGHDGATVALPVTNSGTRAVVVRATVANLTGRARLHPGASWIASIHPAQLHLAPGHTGKVVLTVHVPAGQHGTHFVNYIFHAAPAGSGQLRLSAGVGGTLKLTHPGTLPAPTPHAAAPVHATPPYGLIAIAAALALALAGLALWRTLRRRGGHR
jgi:hypothetical protein